MKTVLITSAAALIMAGAAYAAEVRVVEKPGSDVQVVVGDFVVAPTAPLTGTWDGDVEGMMSADVITGELPPGFDPETIIYIYDDELETGTTTFYNVDGSGFSSSGELYRFDTGMRPGFTVSAPGPAGGPAAQ